MGPARISLDGTDFKMHLINSALQLLAAPTGKTTSKAATSSSGSPLLLIIVVLFGLLYFFMIRPNQRRRMQAMRQARSFELGDEVVAGGMVGRVVRIGEGDIDIEVSPGVVVQFVSQAVQLRSAFTASQQARAGGRGAFGRGAQARPSASPPTGDGRQGGAAGGPVIDVADSNGTGRGPAGDGLGGKGTGGQVAPDDMWPTSGDR